MDKIKFFSELLEEKNIEDIKVIDLSEVSTTMDYFIIGTASSDRHVKSVSDFIDEKAKEQGLFLTSREGKEEGRWILMDYNELIVHIFVKEERELYNLEKLWSTGEFKKNTVTE